MPSAGAKKKVNSVVAMASFAGNTGGDRQSARAAARVRLMIFLIPRILYIFLVSTSLTPKVIVPEKEEVCSMGEPSTVI